MDSYKVTDEGGGIIRVDAQTRLMRKPMASAICAEVDELVADYGEFKILMNMSAMSKGTPAAGLYVLGSMKKYPLAALALFGANGFMRGMANVVLGIARFSNFELFDEEALARDWLERADATPPPSPTSPVGTGGLRRFVVPAGVLASAVVLRSRIRRHRRTERAGSPTGG
ncbi:MAG TPA: STAS/SEC14 domain-containing protein [Acidimicrobiia bacterium]|nr:STAS/SEC14 domain-containing protein [Acidimicrobiia bacterium]